MKPASSQQRNPADFNEPLKRLDSEILLYKKAAERYQAESRKIVTQLLKQLASSQRHQAVSIDWRSGIEPFTTAASPGSMPAVHLTPRETQVLALIACGNSTKQVASALGVTFKTAVGHRSSLMRKLSIHDTANLVRYAIRTGLIQP